ncbi:ADP-ribosylglycohydrolase family protein [Saccharopolyspora mangrovi]|uniref:ADP-ribosylglycohydrolase family protein n=1 Tax=Saccharopolyspora mangrovi TaxID=3082379 RepID=A0ABU6AB31_9PSEU|nr:ADP-ribosylglycohydrolase family protein [Saccharopolyspora sp. S2-29]MEB3368720.1 ADP-ribosylglycohydrolase family protein [Saccharopolyspora sp. S2-29]
MPVRRTVLGEGLASERAQRFLGSVVGAMIGDALGHRVASSRWPEIRERFGEAGVTSLEPDAESDELSDGLVVLALSLDARIRFDRALVRGLDPVAELRGTYALWTSGSGAVPQRSGWLGKHLPQRLSGSRAVDAVAAGLSGRPVSMLEFLYAAIPAGVWSLRSREVIAHAERLCAVLGMPAESVAAAQALAVILQQTVMTKNFVRGFGQVVEVDADEFGPGREEVLHLMRTAESLARPGITPEQIETLGDGSTPASALAIAACAVQSAGTGFDEVMRIAVNHSGNSVVTGALAGAIMGASFEGLDVIPPHWAEGLSTSAKLVFRLAQDVPEQLEDFPRDDDEWNQRYPLILDSSSSAAPPFPASPIDAHERFLGSMLGGAMGDALGYAIEFDDIGMIRHRHGGNGLTEPVLRDGVAQISDDTQMMLFTLEGLIRAHVARRMKPTDNDPVPEVQHAYQRWFHTQGPEWRTAGGPYAQHLQRPDGWLITNWELFASRAPGSTCMSALSNFAQTGVSATPQHRINDSKGCGGVMRAAPVAVWSNDPAEVFYAAAGTAALTHSHPSGFLSAGVLAVIVHQLIREVPLRDSVRLARELLTRWREHEEQLRVLDKAVALAERGPVPPEEIAQELGGGWVGEEALAIGLYAVLATDDLRDALLLSVNHSGDSDSTGMVCGNIGGAVYGTRAIPADWLETLELRGLVETAAKDALAEFSPGPPTDPGWAQRYPAW